ncbi:hypothetical protein GCM10027275_46860 [Rhabdobacter roseus]|uniref:RNA polymerase sigma factor (Sigma-70 family) n=1 Tax=Rhabdobacter roseus TaxID=1655419 RepID=A0A840U248_9BACT|nr:sigma-70 family RNA polymerase sigma factor [Rhabdobacter roseus]MBB5286438.1 RNA polymerase sigma factor (sigma-70 family) [Rhabdobacter roseus]
MAARPLSDTDQTLWHRLRQGDEGAFTELAEHHYRKLLNYGRKFSANQPLLEDALQELLVNLWLRREHLGDPPSVRLYLLKAYRHQLFKAIKQDPFRSSDDLSASDEPLEFSIEDTFIRNEKNQDLQERLYHLINELPERQKEMIYLRFYQGLSVEEIAQLLDLKPQSVSNALQRALANLRDKWPHSLLALLFLLGWSLG